MAYEFTSGSAQRPLLDGDSLIRCADIVWSDSSGEDKVIAI